MDMWKRQGRMPHCGEISRTIQVKTMTLKHFSVTCDRIKLSSLALATRSLFKCGPLPRSCVSS